VNLPVFALRPIFVVFFAMIAPHELASLGWMSGKAAHPSSRAPYSGIKMGHARNPNAFA
tara:strand:+ start:3684 stop:3860 length:177 start_codon:yes stop_codon:yes gene_type:complete